MVYIGALKSSFLHSLFSSFMTEEQLNLIWKSALGEIKPKLSQAVFKTWFYNTSLISLNNDIAEIGVDNKFNQRSLEKFTQDDLLLSLNKYSNFKITKINYIIKEKNDPEKKKEKPDLFNTESFSELKSNSKADKTFKTDSSQEGKEASNLNPKYTFKNFIVGNKNRLAYAAAKKVAEEPGYYNPLYIYGGVGLGKTHLMQAVGNEIINNEPQKRVIYASCENFTNEFTMSIRNGKMENFKRKYRNIDVFLVDDIQFIAGKDSSQEEFFHTFNALYQTNKQIIITSDKTPSEIKGLEERLSSRFASGMIADMQLPDSETRQAILLSKCEEKNIKLPNEVLEFIADLIETNVRELEGVLTRVLFELEVGKQEPSIENVKQILKDFKSNRPIRRNGMENLKKVVCEYYGIELKDLVGKCRQKELVKPRQVLMYLLKTELGMTFPSIGREIGGRDHTTAMHSVDKIEKEMKYSDDLLQELRQVKALYYGNK